MQLTSIPRHQIETRLVDYAEMASAIVSPSRYRNAVLEFERVFANYVGCRHAIAIASGRLGIHLILEAIEAPKGSEAIVPAFNLHAVIERFCQLGIVPRFCDIRDDDLNIDPGEVEQCITPKTRFLLATHMFGHAADMDRLGQMARDRDLVLLEDCAHALGTRFNGQMVGTFGRAAIFSFSVLKLVTTFGGGMIATNDDELAARIRTRLAHCPPACTLKTAGKRALTGTVMDWGTRSAMFSLCAWPALRAMRFIRPNFQQAMMTESPQRDRSFQPENVEPLHPFQGRLGLGQLVQVEEFIEKRRRVVAWLDDALGGIPQVRLLRSTAASRHNGLYYGVLARDAAELSEHLFRCGIDCETSEYRNCAELEIYREFATECPVARDVGSQILRLPNYPSLAHRDVRRIADSTLSFYAPPDSIAESSVSTWRQTESASA